MERGKGEEMKRGLLKRKVNDKIKKQRARIRQGKIVEGRTEGKQKEV